MTHASLTMTPDPAVESLRSIMIPVAAAAFVIAGAGTLFRPAYIISAAPTVAVASKQAASNDKIAMRDTQPPAASASRPDSSEFAKPSDEIAKMVTRAQGLVAVGDFAAARLLLTRAADAGNADAVFALAATYDPNVLSARGARGLVGEPEQAKLLYARALAAGMQDARPRMAALGG